MSMLGDEVGTTSSMVIVPSTKNWVRTSLVLLPTTSCGTARPEHRATWPANTLPKLPVGTEKATGDRRPPRRSAATT